MDEAAKAVFGVVVPVSLLFMAVMLAAGVCELLEAMWTFDWPWRRLTDFFNHLVFGGGGVIVHSDLVAHADVRPMPGAESSIGSTILALEMFILAPLPYLVLEGMALHVTKHSNEKDYVRAKADASLPKTKAIVASILVSTVAVHIVGDVLNRDKLNWGVAASELLIIVVLTGYYVLMEKAARTKEALAAKLEKAAKMEEELATPAGPA